MTPAQLAELDALLDDVPVPAAFAAALGLPPGATLGDVGARPGLARVTVVVAGGPPEVVRAALDAAVGEMLARASARTRRLRRRWRGGGGGAA